MGLAAGLAVSYWTASELLQAGLRELAAPSELTLLAGRHWLAPLELVASLVDAPSTCSYLMLMGGRRWQELSALVQQGRSLAKQRWALGLELCPRR